jgi:hypothetical protein
MSEAPPKRKAAILRLPLEKVTWLKSRIIAAIKATPSDGEADAWIDIYNQLKEAEKYPVDGD